MKDWLPTVLVVPALVVAGVFASGAIAHEIRLPSPGHCLVQNCHGDTCQPMYSLCNQPYVPTLQRDDVTCAGEDLATAAVWFKANTTSPYQEWYMDGRPAHKAEAMTKAMNEYYNAMRYHGKVVNDCASLWLAPPVDHKSFKIGSEPKDD